MTDCSEIRLLLGAYLDDEAEPHEIVAIEGHLEVCPACAGVLIDERALGAALRALPAASIPPDFSRLIARRIARLHGGWRVRLGRLRESFGRLGAALEVASVAAAAAVLTLVLAGPYLNGFEFSHHWTSPSLQAAAQSQSTHPAARQIASRQHRLPSARTTTLSQNVFGRLQEADSGAALDGQQVISALGGGVGPSVAVWNEPRTDTTVVWVPDQR